MKNNMIIITIGLVLLVGALVYFGSDLSVVSSDVTYFEVEGLTCNVPNDCYTSMINDFGFPQDRLDDQLVGYELVCESGACGVKEQ